MRQKYNLAMIINSKYIYFFFNNWTKIKKIVTHFVSMSEKIKKHNSKKIIQKKQCKSNVY